MTKRKTKKPSELPETKMMAQALEGLSEYLTEHLTKDSIPNPLVSVERQVHGQLHAAQENLTYLRNRLIRGMALLIRSYQEEQDKDAL